MPVGGLAFAVEPAGEAAEVEQTDAPVTQDDSAAVADEQPIAVPESGEADNAPAQEAILPSAPADEQAAAPVASAGQVSYVATSAQRISADVPATDSAVTVGDIEYNGLTYRINPDGTTVSLIGLGVGNAAAVVNVPAQIATVDATYEVTAIVGKNGRGGVHRIS